MSQASLFAAIKAASKLSGIKALGVILRAAIQNREDQRIAREQGIDLEEESVDFVAERMAMVNMLDMNKIQILDNLI